MRRCGALVATAALLLAGCGAGSGDTPEQVRLSVTRDFGARDVASAPTPEVTGSDTVMRLLQRNAEVTTRFGGNFVQSIDGIAGGRRAGRPVDWFFYVNGVLEDEGATSVKVRAGDRVWWDHHDWGEAMDIFAVVGSWPEPFRRGIDGKRLPTRLECVDPDDPACDEVAKRLGDAGVVAGRAGLNAGENANSLRVLVGTWDALRKRDPVAERLGEGPASSGVFVRFDRAGTNLTVLDPRGRPVRRLGAGTGLVAASRLADRPPAWLVTGIDAAGVAKAAQSLDEGVLADRFAVAVPSSGGPVAVPEVTG